jgi:NitT/TauT family transport system substrate-binding protein
MKRLTGLIVVLTVSLLLAPRAAAPQSVAQATAPKPLKPFTFILDFLPYGEYAPFFVALEKGFYRDEGLDVKILRGAGAGDTVKRIAAGQGDAGAADLSVITALRANEDVKVKAIAAYIRQTWLGFFVREGSGIDTPKHLEGKTFATSPGNAHQILFPLYAELAGINAESIKWVTMDGAAMGPALITKQVDVAPFSKQHEARLQKQARQQGLTIKQLAFRDVGMDLYGICLIARETNIARDADSLRAFVRGSLRGMKYAWEPANIEEGARIVVKRNPEVDLDAAVGAAQVASQYGLTEDVRTGKLALGQFASERVRKGIDTYTQYMKLARKVQPEDVYTNDLLPEKK